MPKTHYYIRVSISPSNLNLISSIPLCNRTLRDTRRLPGLEPQQPCMRNHNPIINTKPLIRSIHLSPSIPGHNRHHLLQSLITTYSPDNQDLLTSHVGHGAFGDFHQHCKDCFLEAETEVFSSYRGAGDGVFERAKGGGQRGGSGQDTGEGTVHSFDYVGELDEVFAPEKLVFDRGG